MTYGVRGELKRDLKVTTIVTGAHKTDHFLQLVLPPLFPLLKVTYGVSYTDLGLLMALFYVASGLCRRPAFLLIGSARAVCWSAGLLRSPAPSF